jgi:hypothetical protein
LTDNGQQDSKDYFLRVWRGFDQQDVMSKSATNWLDQQCRSIDTIRAGAMLLNAGPEGSRSARVINWPSNSDVNPHLLKLAQSAMTTNEPQWKVLERPGEDGAETTAVAYPLCNQGDVQGAVTVEYTGSSEAQRTELIRDLQMATPRLLAQLSKPASEPAVVGIAGVPEATRSLIEDQANLISLIVEAVEPQKLEVAYTGLVNDLARRFKSRRVSLGEVGMRRISVRAISNMADFDKRSSIVRSFERAMGEGQSFGRTVHFPDEENAGFEERLTAHQTLVLEEETGFLLSLPLAADGAIFGMLLFERGPDEPFSDSERETLEKCMRLIGPILRSKQKVEMPLVRKLMLSGRHMLVATFGSRLLATKIMAVLIICGISFLIGYTDTYRVTGDASVQPISKFVVTSPLDGYIAHSYHKVGDVVTKDEPLVDLDQRDLKLEYTKWEGELAKLTKEYRAALARRDRTEVRIIQNRQAQVRTQLELVETLLKRSKLLAPIDGIIIQGDLDEAGGSPVARGQLLFEVAQLDDYRVEILVDEKDIADIREHQTGQLLLASMPDRPVEFSVDTIVPVAQGEEGINAFMVYAKLADSSSVRPGMEGIAKVQIGQKNLMWIFTHKLTDWISLQWWRLGW